MISIKFTDYLLHERCDHLKKATEGLKEIEVNDNNLAKDETVLTHPRPKSSELTYLGAKPEIKINCFYNNRLIDIKIENDEKKGYYKHSLGNDIDIISYKDGGNIPISNIILRNKGISNSNKKYDIIFSYGDFVDEEIREMRINIFDHDSDLQMYVEGFIKGNPLNMNYIPSLVEVIKNNNKRESIRYTLDKKYRVIDMESDKHDTRYTCYINEEQEGEYYSVYTVPFMMNCDTLYFSGSKSNVLCTCFKSNEVENTTFSLFIE